ncbi:glycosyltransferase family 2 protein [Bacteroides ndongoniae]|uniref:glycosyltransferase family 2 protein n=1 Tax=Bacteroides ndongoniae TaxID=1903262 RepID=UPI0008DAF058|nr:glycosyltransferase family 2 protein [Bacteroides ndongoniae]
MEREKIGIVTVLYNSESVLEDFFRTLNEQTYKNFILYLVDNNSNDLSVSKGREYSGKVDFECKWLLQNENVGVAEGNNIGIKAALADGCNYILLSNNDVVLQGKTIEVLLDGMLSMNASMAVPKIYYWDNPQKIWMAGGGFQWLQFSTFHRGEGCFDKGQYNKKISIKYAPTCFMLINATVFARVGFMDKRYFVYYDDTDFVWRSVKLGIEKLVYIPESVLLHKVSSCTGGAESDFSIYYSKRNHIYFARKFCHGIHFIIFTCYLIVHFLFRKLFLYDRKKLILILRSYKDGWNLYKYRS